MAGEDVVITLSGDSGALAAAIRQAADQFTMLRQTMSVTADTAKVFGDTFAQQAQAWLTADDSLQVYSAKLAYLREQMALTGTEQDIATQSIREYTQQLSLTRQTMTTLDEASRLLGDGFAAQSAEWMNAATSADDYAARLAYVREQIAFTQDQLNMQNADMNATAGAFSSFGGGGLSGIVSGLSGMGLLGDLGGPLGMLAGGIDSVVGGMGQFVSQSASFLGAMAGWTIIQDVTSWVQQLSSEMFNLNVQTEKSYTGWKYLFGGGTKGQAAATDMMQWTSQFSMNIPFTRQDLMGAVTTLSTTGLSPAAIEQFMPFLSDLAATYGSASYGGQGINLQGAANAIRMLSQGGQSRLLKYDLNINPEQLLQYGLKGTQTSTGVHITDPNSVFVALENFARAKGVAGASGGIVDSTWWGGWSSLIDNFQNLLLNIGGTNLNGSIRKGSFFADIKGDLDNLLTWFSDHQGELNSFADTISKLLGGGANNLVAAAQDLRPVFTSFWAGVTSSGVGQAILKDVEATMAWLGNPENQHKLEEMGLVLGQGIGANLSAIATALGKVETGMDTFMQRMRPQDIALIADMFGLISYNILAAADAMNLLAQETLDFAHLSQDISNGNWSAVSGDMAQFVKDENQFKSNLNQDWNTATGQDAQMQLVYQQWKLQNPDPFAPSKGAAKGSLMEYARGHLSEQMSGGSGGHSTTTPHLAASLINLNHTALTNAAQSVMDEFARGILNAVGAAGDVGHQVAAALGAAIEEHVAAQFRTQKSGQALATNTPGGWRNFGAHGAGW